MSSVLNLLACLLFLLHLATVSKGTQEEPLRLWYDRPAASWNEALPVGNGHMGAMIFGDPLEERIQFNENTLVSDEPGYRALPLDVRRDFDEVRRLLAARKFAEADVRVQKKWLGRAWACYQPMGDLRFSFDHTEPIANYQRELSLEDATLRVRYQSGGVTFTREIIASHPDRVIAIRLTASKPGSLSFRVRLQSPHPTATSKVDLSSGTIDLAGQVPGLVVRRTLDWLEKNGETWKYPELFSADGKRLPHAKQVLYGREIGGRGTFFHAQLRVKASGGTVEEKEGHLSIRAADEVVLLLGAATSYNGFDKSPSREGIDPAAKASAFIDAAAASSFDELFARHKTDYHGLFARVSLRLGPYGPQSALTTDQRIKLFANGQDLPLAALYFQFGRYLMIAGSRPGGQPLNLQGLWNEEIIPPWASGYTININTEMNYWPAEVTNLSECTEPLLRMIRELSVDGTRVARDMYGRRGWVAHHNTTLWRCAQPVDYMARTAFWPLGGAWLTRHLVEHHLFTGDRAFLADQAYPLLKGSAEFYLDWLVQDSDGHLITPVGSSPENQYSYTDSGSKVALSGIAAGPTMDIAIIRDLFQNTLDAAKTLDCDSAFRDELARAMAKLRPYRIGSQGQLLEWPEEFKEPDPQHRHVSHLYGLHPAAGIHVRNTPELAAAARRTLELRGEGGTGWSMAWKINFQARLENGAAAGRMVRNLITQSTLPNLLDTCPPFQIDGNFGGCAGIAEMLLQSHAGEIVLLPALPPEWREGSVTGLRARGGAEVDIEWRNGKLVAARIATPQPASFIVRYVDHTAVVSVKPGQSVKLNGRLRPDCVGGIKWKQPAANAVFQRDATGRAAIPVLLHTDKPAEIRAIDAETQKPATSWAKLEPVSGAASTDAQTTLLVSTGWWCIEVRLAGTGETAVSSPFGVGEVFIAAGQSNSANHGSERQRTKHPRALACDWRTGQWVPLVDSLPGTTGNGGSPWPLFADALDPSGVTPVGILAVGVGSTSVGQWLPDVENSNYPRLQAAIRLTGRNGFRAILWHQGESDSLAGTSAEEYANRLSTIISRSRADAEREVPWGIARASEHPGDAATPEREAAVRNGQDLVIASTPMVFAGPTTDGYRELKRLASDKVHFNAEGLKAHAIGWAAAVRPMVNP